MEGMKNLKNHGCYLYDDNVMVISPEFIHKKKYPLVPFSGEGSRAIMTLL